MDSGSGLCSTQPPCASPECERTQALSAGSGRQSPREKDSVVPGGGISAPGNTTASLSPKPWPQRHAGTQVLCSSESQSLLTSRSNSQDFASRKSARTPPSRPRCKEAPETRLRSIKGSPLTQRRGINLSPGSRGRSHITSPWPDPAPLSLENPTETASPSLPPGWGRQGTCSGFLRAGQGRWPLAEAIIKLPYARA